MGQLFMGSIATGSLFAGLFFLRFWYQTHDRLFLYFAGSFWLDAVSWVSLALVSHADEQEPLFYAVRLAAYTLILVAIWQKNRGRR